MNSNHFHLTLGSLFLFLTNIWLGSHAFADAGSISWRCSTSSEPWVDKGQLTPVPWDEDKTLYVQVNDTKKAQQIIGWGGCFNEKGWDTMLVLSDEERTGIMKALFDPNDGLKLNVCRTPIGASDYALNSYSLDDSKDDYQMAHFSIDRDKEELIPYIKAAMEIRPDLKLWAVPWSPPAWMKNNNLLLSGFIKSDSKTFDALALYFEKYVQAYRKEGINIFMVMPQNEPTERPNYPSCFWNGVQLHDFIKDHLGPKFAADSLNCEIWLGTLTNPDYSYVTPTVDDPAALAFIKGIGFQWYAKTSCLRVHQEHPDIPLMQSETMCGNGENNWHYAESQFDLMKTYFDYGVSYYMLWNMVLDQTGRSTNNWRQCSPIVVNKVTRSITYNPQYYLFKHFSYYINPGAYKIFTDGNYEENVAFTNANGETVLELANNSDKDLAVSIIFNGKMIKPALPAHSFNTFITSASN